MTVPVVAFFNNKDGAQEARKPIFLLRSADGAIGAHQRAVRDAYGHFESLTRRLLSVTDLEVAA